MESFFSPSLHKQRHQFVIDFVKRNKPLKVVDLGCCDCSLLKKLRFHREIDLLVGVDLKESTLKENMHCLAPFPADYLQPGFDQLRVELYQGSVTERESRLRRFDLVTSIELIEHLTTAEVKLFSEVVFGFMTPVFVIVSTPNAEFNPLFPGLRGFRHRDHKFEWSRAEFKSWALKVCVDFGYEVEFTGVGEAPSGYRDNVGFCSQIGVFHRLGGGDESNTQRGDDAEEVFPYKLLYSINYPSLRDNNTLRKVLVSEVLCWTEELKKRWREERNHSHPQCESEGAAGGGGGGGEEHVSEQSAETEQKQTVCKAERSKPAWQSDNAASEEVEEEEDGGLLWANERRQRTSCTSHRTPRCVSVPLDVLWSSCPKVKTLSGSLRNLAHLLMDQPKIRLSQGGDALLVSYPDDDHDELEDSGYAEARLYSRAAEQAEDWEAIV